MPEPGRTYLVECYLPGVDARDVAAAGNRAHRASKRLVAQGREVAYLGAMLVAADEAVFHAFLASDADVVGEASRRAGLAFERVVESVQIPGDPNAVASRGLFGNTQAPVITDGS